MESFTMQSTLKQVSSHKLHVSFVSSAVIVLLKPFLTKYCSTVSRIRYNVNTLQLTANTLIHRSCLAL